MIDPRLVDLPGGRQLTIQQCTPMSDEYVGATVWDVSVALVQTLCELRVAGLELPLEAARTAVELGSGTGYLGLALAGLGVCTERMVLTDVAEFEAFLGQNAAANAAQLGSVRTDARVLRWGNDDDIAALRKDAPEIDLVCAGDVLYMEDHPLLVKQTIDALGAKRVLIAGEERRTFVADFEAAMREDGWHCERLALGQDWACAEFRVLLLLRDEGKSGGA